MAGYLTLTLVLWASLAAQAQAAGLSNAELLIRPQHLVPSRLVLSGADSTPTAATAVVRLVPLAGKLVVLTGVEAPAAHAQHGLPDAACRPRLAAVAPPTHRQSSAYARCVPARAP